MPRSKKQPAPATDQASPPLSPAAKATTPAPIAPAFQVSDPDTRLYIGDCREVLPAIPEVRSHAVDLVFADPPFNWNRGYDKWDDAIPEPEYLDFTYRWIDLCIDALRPGGSMWINIPDDWAAEIVVHCKSRSMRMVNWCIWHYRFGQNTKSRFINSKVHALFFAKPEGANPGQQRTWNPLEVLEATDRATTYFDPRTNTKADGFPAGKRVPLDVWYGPGFSRIQGNNQERRPGHDNQLPEAYLARVIKACSNPGDLVLDPFNGSGTTGTVARHLNRRFIGTEYSPDLAQAAFVRMTEVGVRSKQVLDGEIISSAIFEPRNASLRAKQRTMGGLQVSADEPLFGTGAADPAAPNTVAATKEAKPPSPGAADGGRGSSPITEPKLARVLNGRLQASEATRGSRTEKNKGRRTRTG